MRLADHYRQLDLEPGASFEDVKRAHRDLTKVWHPDRFGHDEPLRRKAEEKLKAINQAFAAIRDADDESRDDVGEVGPWRVRYRGREAEFPTLSSIVHLIDRGSLPADAEVRDPSTMEWVGLRSIPQLREAFALVRARRNRGWAMACVALAIFVLLRRPTPGGILIALVLLVAALVLGLRIPIGD